MTCVNSCLILFQLSDRWFWWIKLYYSKFIPGIKKSNFGKPWVAKDFLLPGEKAAPIKRNVNNLRRKCEIFYQDCVNRDIIEIIERSKLLKYMYRGCSVKPLLSLSIIFIQHNRIATYFYRWSYWWSYCKHYKTLQTKWRRSSW